MSNYPDECDRCGLTADLCAYTRPDGDIAHLCPECMGEIESQLQEGLFL